MKEKTYPTDAELTQLYKEANGEIGGKRQPLTTQRIFKAMRAAIEKWGTPTPAGGLQPEAEVECTCAARDMPFGTCCKVRSAFEKWYDGQGDGRLQPFDVFKGGWQARAVLAKWGTPTPAGETVAMSEDALVRAHGITKGDIT
jgi:hypothetical protein